MAATTKEQAVEKEGIDVDGITFDANGNVQGLDDSELNDIAAGLMEAKDNEGCINAANCK